MRAVIIAIMTMPEGPGIRSSKLKWQYGVVMPNLFPGGNLG